MAYEDFKVLTRITASEKILRDKAFNIVKNLEYFEKKSALLADKSASSSGTKNENVSSNVKEKRKVHSSFNIWEVDPADMKLISKSNKGIRFLLFVVDIFSKYAWDIPLKNKKSITIINTFPKILKQSNRKLNKIWVDKGSEFYNRSMKSWLEKNYVEMHSTHNEGKSVVAKRFIRTSKKQKQTNL